MRSKTKKKAETFFKEVSALMEITTKFVGGGGGN
jgi:hypothetical protein